jgi:FlaG/FlaF family flagellin (archaellin)
MSRLVLLVTVAAFMVAVTVVLAGTAFAASVNSEHDSCFADYVQGTTAVRDVGPGSFVSEAAQNLPPDKEHIAQAAQELRHTDPVC